MGLGSGAMGRLSTQKKPISSKARLAVLFPDPDNPEMITILAFLSSDTATASGCFPFPLPLGPTPWKPGRNQFFGFNLAFWKKATKNSQ
jgi:hypothetical protein